MCMGTVHITYTAEGPCASRDVIEHFNICVTEKDIFSRCQVSADMHACAISIESPSMRTIPCFHVYC